MVKPQCVASVPRFIKNDATYCELGSKHMFRCAVNPGGNYNQLLNPLSESFSLQSDCRALTVPERDRFLTVTDQSHSTNNEFPQIPSQGI